MFLDRVGRGHCLGVFLPTLHQPLLLQLLLSAQFFSDISQLERCASLSRSCLIRVLTVDAPRVFLTIVAAPEPLRGAGVGHCLRCVHSRPVTADM